MRWDARDFIAGTPVALAIGFVAAFVLYPGTGWVIADDIRPGMTRAQVAARLGTDGELDPHARQFASVSLSPNSGAPPYIARASRVNRLQMRTYTCLFHTFHVWYDGHLVDSASVPALDWEPKTWPGVLKLLLGFVPLVCVGAELSRRTRRWWTEPPYPPADRCA